MPLPRAADGEHTGLLNWPTAGGGGSKLPLVRTTKGGQQLGLWQTLRRGALCAKHSGCGGCVRCVGVAELHRAALVGFSYTAGTAAASTGGVSGYLITKVGPIMSSPEDSPMATAPRVRTRPL